MSYWIILLASVAAPVKCNKLEQMGKMIAWANITSNTLLELTLIIIVTTNGQIILQGVPEKHPYKIFGLEIMLFTCSQT